MGWRAGILWTAIWLAAAPAAAVTITIDYSYDQDSLKGGTNFFGDGNPQGPAAGQAARAAMQAAADFYSSLLTDTFNPITVPQPFHSTKSGSSSTRTWSWVEDFSNPNITSTRTSVPNPTVSSNQFVVYAGSQAFTGTTHSNGAPGNIITVTHVDSGSGGFMMPADDNQMNAIEDNFNSAVVTRGQTSGFARWGGSVSFDNRASADWFFGYPSAVPTGKYDFYSSALHELAHTLGFGEEKISISPWYGLVNQAASTFMGTTAKALNGGNDVPLDTVSNDPRAHWVQGAQSQVYATTTTQEVLMDPTATPSIRKKLSKLDAAALTDIGWSLVATPQVTGDYSGNRIADSADFAIWRKNLGKSVTLPNDPTPGTVTAADYGSWRNNFGITTLAGSENLPVESASIPEPSTAADALLLGLAVLVARRRPAFRKRAMPVR